MYPLSHDEPGRFYKGNQWEIRRRYRWKPAVMQPYTVMRLARRVLGRSFFKSPVTPARKANLAAG